MSQVTLELNTSEWDTLIRQLSANVKKSQRFLKTAAGIYGFQDIIQHFRDESGPDGRWAPRSAVTQERYAMINSGQIKPPRGVAAGAFNPTNKLLQLTGTLRQSLLPTNKGIENHGSDSVRIFSNVVYSRRHNEGGDGVPKREFMWLSDGAQEKMVNAIIQMILEGEGAA